MNLYISENSNPAFHLALEESLFSGSEEEFLLFYVNQPSVVMGCNQVLQNEVDVDFCRNHNIGIYRRMTGGGTVYHDAGNLNFAFIVRKNAEFAGMSGKFLQPILNALHQLEVMAFQGKRKDLWIPGEFKISGTASHLKGMREIHHGTLLFDTDLEQLQKAIQPPKKDTALRGIASVPSPVKNIRQYMSEQGLHHYSRDEFFQKIAESCRKLCVAEQIESLPASILSKTMHLVATKYTTEAWNLRK